MAFNSKGITIEINGETTGFDKAMRKVKSSVQGVDTEVTKLTRSIKNNGSTWDTFAAKQDLLVQKQNNYRQQIVLLEDTLSQVQDQMGKLDTSTAQGAKSFNNLTQKLQYTETELAVARSNLEGVSNEIDQGQAKWSKYAYRVEETGQVLSNSLSQLDGAIQKNGNSWELFTAKQQVLIDTQANLSQQIEVTERLIDTQRSKIESYSQTWGRNSDQTIRAKEALGQLEVKLTALKSDLGRVTEEIDENSLKWDKYKFRINETADSIEGSLGELTGAIERNGNSWDLFTAKMDKLKQKQSVLQTQLDMTKQAVERQERVYEELANRLGHSATETQKAKEKLDELKTSVKVAESNLEKLNEEIRDGETRWSQYGYRIKEVVQNIEDNLSKIDTAISKNGNSLKLFLTKMDTLKSKQKALKEQLKQTQTALDQQKEAVKQATTAFGKNSDQAIRAREKLEALRIEVTLLKGELTHLSTEMITGNAMFDSLYFGLDKMGQAAEKAYQRLRPISTLAFAGIVGATKETMDFETALTGVLKTVDATPEQIKKIDDGLKNLATTTASSYEDIAKFAELGGQMGIDPENIVEFSKVITMLSDTTNIIGEDAAQTIAKFANIMSDAKGEDGKVMMDYYSRLGSTIVDLGNNFATTESDIMNLSSRLAAAGDQVGMSTPQVLALSTALSSMGLRTDEAGGSVSKFMQTMALDVANNGETLEAYASISGQTIEQFKKSWGEDAPAAFLRFLEGISKAEDGDERLQKLAEAGLTDSIRVARSFGALTANVDLYKKALNLAGDAWEENSAMEKEANKRYATLAATLSQAKEAIKQAANELGKAFAPMVKKAAEEIKKFATHFAKAPQYVKDFTAKALLGTAALAPLAKGFNKLAEGGKSVIKSVGEMIRNFNPLTFGLKVAAGATVAAVVAIEQYKNSLVEKRKAEDADYAATMQKIELQNEQISQAKELVKSGDTLVISNQVQEKTAENLISKIGELTEKEKLSADQKDKLRYYVELLNELYPELGFQYDEETGKVKNNTGEVMNNTAEIEKNTKAVMDNARQKAIADAHQEYLEAVVQAQMAYEGATEGMKYYKQEMDECYKKTEELRNSGQANTEEFKILTERATTASEAYEELKGQVKTAADTLYDANTKLAESWALGADGTRQFTDELKNQFSELKKNAGENAVQIPQQFVDAINNKTMDVTAACELLGSLMTFQQGVDNAGYYAGQIPVELVNKILDGCDDVGIAVEQLNNLIEFSQALNEAGITGVEIPEEMAAGIANGTISVTSAKQQLINSLKKDTSSSEAGKKAGNDYVQETGKPIKNDTSVKTAAGGMAKDATAQFKDNLKVESETATEINHTNATITNSGMPGRLGTQVQFMNAQMRNLNIDGIVGAQVTMAKNYIDSLSGRSINIPVTTTTKKVSGGNVISPFSLRTQNAASFARPSLYTAPTLTQNAASFARPSLYTAPTLTDSVTQDGIGGMTQSVITNGLLNTVISKLSNIGQPVDVSGIRSDLKTIAKNQNQQANVYLGQERVGNMTYEYGNKRRAFDDFMDAALAGGTL